MIVRHVPLMIVLRFVLVKYVVRASALDSRLAANALGYLVALLVAPAADTQVEL